MQRLWARSTGESQEVSVGGAFIKLPENVRCTTCKQVVKSTAKAMKAHKCEVAKLKEKEARIFSMLIEALANHQPLKVRRLTSLITEVRKKIMDIIAENERRY